MRYVWVPISQDKFTLIDADCEHLFQRKWHLAQGYVTYNSPRSPTSAGSKLIRLHRVILDAPDGMVVDHINGDTLDNRKCNLRLVTTAQNAMNARKKGKFKGVTFKKDKGRLRPYYARIVVNYKTIPLGSYDNEISAALAYNEAAIKYFGEFACLNNIPLSEVA